HLLVSVPLLFLHDTTTTVIYTLSLHDALPIFIDYVDGKPKQVAKATAAFDHCGISEGIGCDVCAQVCPRLGLREFDLRDEVLPKIGKHTSELQSRGHLVCRLLLEKKNTKNEKI